MRIRSQAFIVGFVVLLASASAWLGTTSLIARQTTLDSTLYSGLRWRMLGPFRGGRVDAVSGVPAGRTSSTSARSTAACGRRSTPAACGRRSSTRSRSRRSARSPSRRRSPDTVYVGSGESTLRDSTGYGNGMYKSTDAGKTWTHIGLDDTQHIGKIAVDPKNPNIVFVAAIGHLYDAHPERGVFRSQDGGKTWTESAVQGRQRRRRRRRDRSDELAGRLRRRCGIRAGRPGTPTSRRTDRAAASSSRRTAARPGSSSTNGLPASVHRPKRASPSRRAIRGASTPSSMTSCLRAHRRARRVRARRRAAAAAPVAARRPQAAPGDAAPRRRRAASTAPTTPARRGRRCPATRRSGAAAGTSSKIAVDPKNADIVYVPNVAVIAIEGRRQDVGAAARIAGRRRLPPGVGLARRPEHDDRRERSGRDHHAQRARPTIRAT